MKRTNTFAVHPRTDEDRELLRRLLDASAGLWNKVTYERRQRFFDDKSVWEATDHSDRYKDVISATTAQQILRKNDTAWKSFFALHEKWKHGTLEHRPSPPGYWGNEKDGRELRTYIRHDLYRVRWATGATKQSILDVPVGSVLKEEYELAYHDLLRLDAVGNPQWQGDQGQLELYYDDLTETFRAHQPIDVNGTQQESPLANEAAALDIGANTLVACTVSTGARYLYDGRALFDRFRETTEQIADYQSKLDNQQRTSKRIDRLYRKRTKRRNHAQDALVRDLLERLHEVGVATVYVGDLTGVLSKHWSCTVNEKTHTFWAFRRFTDRLKSVAEEHGITVDVDSEAWTTQECPECGERDATDRTGDLFACACGYEGHADLCASAVFLDRQTTTVGPMARPVCLQWDNHDWCPAESLKGSSDDSHRRLTIPAPRTRTKPNEDHTN